MIPLYPELSALFEADNRIYNNNQPLFPKEPSIAMIRLLRSEFGSYTSNNSYEHMELNNYASKLKTDDIIHKIKRSDSFQRKNS